MKKHFTIVEANGRDGYYRIIPNDYETFPMNTKAGGSYALAPARLLGISYPDYIRYIATTFPNDVAIFGKNCVFLEDCWRKGASLSLWLDLLNNKMELAIKIAETENLTLNENHDIIDI